VGQMLSSGYNVIMWMKCYHVEAYAIMCGEILSSGANVIMWS